MRKKTRLVIFIISGVHYKERGNVHVRITMYTRKTRLSGGRTFFFRRLRRMVCLSVTVRIVIEITNVRAGETTEKKVT